MKNYPKELTREEILALTEKYYKAEGYTPPGWFEHRCDMEYSEQIYYSIIRDFKPKSMVEFGGSFGGSVCVNLAALNKNKTPFKYFVCEKYPDILNQCIANVTTFAHQRDLKTLPTFLGPVEENLDKLPKEIDYLFIDTNHDRENCQWYIDNLFPRLVDGALVHIHDWAIRIQDNQLLWERNEREREEAGEIQLLLELMLSGKLPLRKLYWTWGDGVRTSRGGFEEAASSFWIYKKP